MKIKSKEPSLPAEKHETLRQSIIHILENQTLSAKDISAHISIPEKEVCDHLEHIQKTINTKLKTLDIVPAECNKCGFIFKKRERLKKPGRCPICRGESIIEPLFTIKERVIL
jgi:predicted Zn-ribbon and HTH transcriptional regulator